MVTTDTEHRSRGATNRELPDRVGESLRRAGPTLGAFIAVRVLSLLVFVVAAKLQGRDPWRILVAWDGQWYARIAEHGYGFALSRPDGRLYEDYAFLPLYPIAEKGLAWLTGLSYVHAGLVLSAVASVVAAWGIYDVARLVYGHRVGTLTVLLWAALPVSIVTSMAYTEAVFTAVAAWALYCVLTERWVAAGLLAAAAGLTRPTGLAVVAAVVVPAVLHVWATRREPGWPRSAGRPLVGCLLAPLGWVGYVVWVGFEKGDATGYVDVATNWGNGLDGGAAFASWVWDHVTGPHPVAGIGILLGLAALAALVVAAVRQRQPTTLLVYSLVMVALALATSGFFGSKPRYLLPAFPLLLPVAMRLGPRRRASWVLVGVMTVASAAYGTIWLLGDGPP